VKVQLPDGSDADVILTAEELHDVGMLYSMVDEFAFDVETWGEHRLDCFRNQASWISLATEDRTTVIPMGHPNGEFLRWDKPLLAAGAARRAKGLPHRESDYSTNKARWVPQFDAPPTQLRPAEVFKALEYALFGPSLKFGHNLKFDLTAVAKYYGRFPTGPYWDTMLAELVLDSRTRLEGVGLAQSVKRRLSLTMVKGVGVDVNAHSFDDVAIYSAFDSRATYLLAKAQQALFDTEGMARPLNALNLESEALAAFAEMELAGAPVDEVALGRLRAQLEESLEATTADVYRAAGRPFNINSNAEKRDLLFAPKREGGLALRPRLSDPKATLTPKGLTVYRTKGTLTREHLSVSEPALRAYKGVPVVDALMEYSTLYKLWGTYVVPYGGGDVERTTAGKTKVVSKEGRIFKGRLHPEFKQMGADTSRASCTHPNLQNVPARGDWAKLIRGLFVAPEGYMLVQADWSQIEPRIIASLSGDPLMIRNYLDGADIYTTIGDAMGVARQVGKTLVLAIAYGVGPDTVADRAGCSVKEAESLMEGFDSKFAAVPRHKARVVRTARARKPVPYVETLMGYRRMLPELKSTIRGIANRAERQAYNTLIQGSAAQMMKAALVRVHESLQDEPHARLILTVHDEVLVLCREGIASEVAECVRESMEGLFVPEMRVPLVAETKIVKDWSQCK
jgi:DNA polymerase I-like protein with 3'-5' exonuclease and polymerase domains